MGQERGTALNVPCLYGGNDELTYANLKRDGRVDLTDQLSQIFAEIPVSWSWGDAKCTGEPFRQPQHA